MEHHVQVWTRLKYLISSAKEADFSISASHEKIGKLMEFNILLHKIMGKSWKINLVKSDFTSSILR